MQLYLVDILVISQLPEERHHGSLGLTLHLGRSFLTPQGWSLCPHAVEERDTHSRPEKVFVLVAPSSFRKTNGASALFHDLLIPTNTFLCIVLLFMHLIQINLTKIAFGV